jgi:hypothetical protein
MKTKPCSDCLCKDDHLEVLDVESDGDKSIGMYCGNDAQGIVLYSKGPKMRLKFTTGITGKDSWFQADYFAEKGTCQIISQEEKMKFVFTTLHSF